MTMEKVGMTGQEYVDLASGGNPEQVQMIEDLFSSLGSSTDDVSLAQGSGFGDDEYVHVSVARIAGADGSVLLEAWVQNMIDSAPVFNSAMSASAEHVSLGGKNVTLVTTMYRASVYDESYIYRYGDTIFTVKGGSEEVIAEALSLLP